MKKIRLALFFVLHLSTVFSQGDYVAIHGSVKGRNLIGTKIYFVENVAVILKINDSLKLKTFTNDTGYYEFNIKKFTGTVSLSCEVSKKIKVKGIKNPCLFGSNDKKMINLDKKKDVIYTSDFELQEGCCLLRMPEILFTEGSTQVQVDSVLFLYQIMIDNPQIVVQIDGHTDSKEKDKINLSIGRAKAVQDLLIAKEIEKERVKIVGHGDSQLLINERVISKAPTKEERCALRAKNRRATFKVISFDYGVKEKPINTIKEDDEE